MEAHEVGARCRNKSDGPQRVARIRDGDDTRRGRRPSLLWFEVCGLFGVALPHSIVIAEVVAALAKERRQRVGAEPRRPFGLACVRRVAGPQQAFAVVEAGPVRIEFFTARRKVLSPNT